jgi:hypothetical protein
MSVLPEPQLFLPHRLYISPHPGNRCHQQTKEYNTYLLLLQQGLIEPPTLPNSPSQEPCSPEDTFPNFVLLMVSEEPWEEQPQWREQNEPLSIKWINNLIEE